MAIEKLEIKLKTLISLKDFVLKYHPTREQIVNYAKFIDTPLKLENFIVCDEEGDILEEPTNYEKRLPNMMTEYNDEVYTYYQAKAKVLFENIPIAQAKWLVNTFSTIESLSDIINTITPIYLTESAIKQIGL